ncbi:transcription initiation factor IIF subunit beta [Skeletonema marinoi]|uniref:Transcription initiation factor IIF subunit beta n=1 Tax=Skeletonema marinoi TaxID=267567 RepID=A0AAD9DGP0_9STRA|nr:transcription initiation factor IIF subunit beta [Skeletonema marinoi]
MSSSSNPSGAGAVSGQTYGAINASTTDHWMIRLPNRLASAWEDAPEGTVLGTLTFTKGGTTNGNSAGQPTAKRQKTNAPSSAPSSSKISITLDPALAESQLDLPVNYSLEAMSKKTNGTLHPFTRNANGGVSIHGLNRLLDTSVNSKRFVQPHADAAPQASKAATFAASLGTGFGGSVAQFGKKVLDAKERQKGFGVEEVSGPPITGADNVRSKLFELFSKRVFWSVKDLIMASGGRLPEKETREILRDIATIIDRESTEICGS